MRPPPKKQPKKQYKNKYLSAWEGTPEFKGWLMRSNYWDNQAFCKLCCKDFKIDHGGKNVSKHAGTAMHIAKSKSQNNTLPVNTYFVTQNDEGKHRDII